MESCQNIDSSTGFNISHFESLIKAINFNLYYNITRLENLDFYTVFSVR